jgi:hypothetical protein
LTRASIGYKLEVEMKGNTMVALWAVIPAMVFMFIAGRKSKRRIKFVNNTDYGLDVVVSPNQSVVVIREVVKPK